MACSIVLRTMKLPSVCVLLTCVIEKKYLKMLNMFSSPSCRLCSKSCKSDTLRIERGKIICSSFSISIFSAVKSSTNFNLNANDVYPELNIGSFTINTGCIFTY